MLPREALNKGVMITPTAIEPMKNGKNDHELCGTPLRKNAGRCQAPQMVPRIRPAQIGA